TDTYHPAIENVAVTTSLILQLPRDFRTGLRFFMAKFATGPLSSWAAPHSVWDQLFKSFKKELNLDRSGKTTVHPRLQTALFVPLNRIGGEGNDRKALAVDLFLLPNRLGGFKPIYLGHVTIRQYCSVGNPGRASKCL